MSELEIFRFGMVFTLSAITTAACLFGLCLFSISIISELPWIWYQIKHWHK